MKINWIFLLVVAVVAIDRLSKIFAQGCNPIFCIERSTNYGAAFGLFQGATILFIVIAAILIPFLIYFLCKTKSNLLRTALALILAGTISNLLDRLIYGYVIDIISLNLFAFPSFNIADAANSIGAVLLIIYLCKKQKLKQT